MNNFNWLNYHNIATLISKLSYPKHKFYFVGGCVRNSILGLSLEGNTDFDIVSNFHPEENLKILQKNRDLKVIPYALEYGTIKIVSQNITFDITTLRKDIKTYGRSADVKFGATLQEDAKRRDLTFNALYLNPYTLEIYDFFNGINDLKNGIVKFIGHPAERIKEDYLRILRFFRFYALFGKHDSSLDIKDTIVQLSPNLKSISSQRIQYELYFIINSSKYIYILDIMNEYKVLESIGLKKYKGLNNKFIINFNLLNHIEELLIKNNIDINIFRICLYFDSNSIFNNITNSKSKKNLIVLIIKLINNLEKIQLKLHNICKIAAQYSLSSTIVALCIVTIRNNNSYNNSDYLTIINYCLKLLPLKLPITGKDILEYNVLLYQIKEIKIYLTEQFYKNPNLSKQALLNMIN